MRAQNEADDAWAIREKNHDRAMIQYDIDKTRWNTSNHKCLMILKGSISDNIKEAIPECTTAVEYLERVKSQFTGSSKAYAANLTEQLVTKRYIGGGNREHILEMSHIANKLKTINMHQKLLLFSWCSSPFPRTLRLLMSTTTLKLKNGT